MASYVNALEEARKQANAVDTGAAGQAEQPGQFVPAVSASPQNSYVAAMNQTATAAVPAVSASPQNSYVAAMNQMATAAVPAATPAATPTPTANTVTGIAAPVTNTAPVNTAQKTATYIDENGNAQTGVVNTAAETEAEEDAAQELTYWEQMRAYYEEQYQQQITANNEAAAATAANALAQIQAKITELNTSYQSVNKQLYRDMMEAKRDLPQQLRAQGYTGGLSESSNLRLRTSYEEALAENERARTGNISEMNTQGVQAQFEAEQLAAEQNAAAAAAKGSYLAALEEQQHQEEETRRKADIQKYTEYGNTTGDYSGLLELGYTQEQVDALKTVWIKQNPQMAITMGYVQAPTPAAERSYGGYVQRQNVLDIDEVNAQARKWVEIYANNGASSEQIALKINQMKDGQGNRGTQISSAEAASLAAYADTLIS